MLDTWIHKAWEMHHQTRCFPATTVLKAVRWLEKQHERMPDFNTAAVISLHYLVLAFREEGAGRPALFEQHVARAAWWKRKAASASAEISSSATAIDEPE
jgi:hypothetical protein